MGSTIRFNTFNYHFSSIRPSSECSRFAALEHVRRKRQEIEKEVKEERNDFKPGTCQRSTRHEQERIKVGREINGAKVE